ncbi:hypothetical protein N5P37_008529, partial [Trichoderma harzianum]
AIKGEKGENKPSMDPIVRRLETYACIREPHDGATDPADVLNLSCKGSKHLSVTHMCRCASGAEEKVDAAHYLLRQPLIECLVADGGDEDSIQCNGKLHKYGAYQPVQRRKRLIDDGAAVIAFYSVLDFDPTSNTDETGDASSQMPVPPVNNAEWICNIIWKTVPMLVLAR